MKEGRYFLWLVFHCAFVRCIDERTGGIQYTGDKNNRDVCQQWLGTVQRLFGLPGSVVFMGRDSIGAIARVEPKYMLLGGVIGAGITWTVIKSMEQLGPAKAALLIVIAQLTVAYVIELFGMFGVEKEPLEWRKLGGLALSLIGVAIFQWK